MDRSTAQPLVYLLVALFYWLVVIGRLQATIDASGAAQGSAAMEALEKEVAELSKKVEIANKRVATKEEELKAELGTLRLTGESNRTPLDALLNAIEQSCREVGATLRQVTPTPKNKTGVFEQEGLQCRIELKSEEHLSALLNSLSEKGRSRNAMIHNLTAARQPRGGVSLAVSFGILRKVVDPKDKAQFADMETWMILQRDRAPFANAALLEPRPAPAPPPPPKPIAKPPPPPPAQLAATKPAPPPAPSFSGRLLGVGSSDGGRDAAILEVGGAQELVAQGDKVGSWTVRSVEFDRVVLENGSQTTTLWFREEESSDPESDTATGPGERARSVRGAPPLGFTGTFKYAAGASLPAPYEKLTRVFTVSAVADASIASRAGLRPGDQILAIDTTPLRVGDQLLGLRAKLAGGHEAALEISRNRSILQVALNP